VPSYKKYLIISVVLSFFVSCTIKDAEFKNEKENRKYLKVEEKEAAKRVFLELQGENKRNEGQNLDSEEKVLKSIIARGKNDNKIYMDLYGIDIRDEKHFDFVLDTTRLSIEEVFEKVMEFINSKVWALGE